MLKYLLELKYRLIYIVLSCFFFFLTNFSYFSDLICYIIKFLFFLDTFYFIYTKPTDLLVISNLWAIKCTVFFFLHILAIQFFFFLVPSLFLYEAKYILKIFLMYFIFLICYIIFFTKLLYPSIWFFFFFFNKINLLCLFFENNITDFFFFF